MRSQKISVPSALIQRVHLKKSTTNGTKTARLQRNRRGGDEKRGQLTPPFLNLGEKKRLIEAKRAWLHQERWFRRRRVREVIGWGETGRREGMRVRGITKEELFSRLWGG